MCEKIVESIYNESGCVRITVSLSIHPFESLTYIMYWLGERFENPILFCVNNPFVLEYTYGSCPPVASTVMDALFALLHVISEIIKESIATEKDGSKISTESVNTQLFSSVTVKV